MKSRLFPFVLSILLAGQALAQSAAFDLKIADVTLLTLSEIKKELAVTEPQRARMNVAAKPYNDLSKKLRDKYEGKEKGPSKAELDQLTSTQQKMRAGVLAVLTPSQLKRLREITLQDAGIVCLVDPDVSKEIGISAQTVKNMQAKFQNGVNKSSKLMADAEAKVQKEFANKKPKNQTEADKLRQDYGRRIDAEIKRISPQLNKIKADTEASVMGMLSAAQKSKMQALLGKPFHPKQP